MYVSDVYSQWCYLIRYDTCRYDRTVQAMIFNVLVFMGEAVSGFILHVSSAYNKNASLHFFFSLKGN